MQAENLVVKGLFFHRYAEKTGKEDFDKVKDMIFHCMRDNGFTLHSRPFQYSFATMQFNYIVTEKPKQQSILDMIRKKPKDTPYFATLKTTKDSAPWTIYVKIEPGKQGGVDGLLIEITSEPAIFHKIEQLSYNFPVSESDYSFIRYYNVEFINKVAGALFLYTVKEPQFIKDYIRTEISSKVKTFGFYKVGNLLEEGRAKLEVGNTKDGLVDLRSATEIFLMELITKLGGTPKGQDKISVNLQMLEDMGYIDKHHRKLLYEVIYHGVYDVLSDTVTHKRENVDLFNANLYFNLSEQIFDYLIERALRYNVKVKTADIDKDKTI